MKVLFAVSNEEISESIVKKYQKEYKQIISYKNVYYFNAILKEIQKDKTYDRIVISEDLESFTNTQYDQIDKFIFEKLDSISDEASNQRGIDIPIILICSDRRTKSEQLLVKLFGIGVYNAIIGNDRSVDEVCRLINIPRSKKDAKTYYNIDVEDVKYQAESENDVSEMEIQNIIAHYKRLGKNEEKYIESFENIAAQYNDTQLRIISKFLPLNVRAVLEEKCPKYQKVMSFNNSVSNALRYESDVKEKPKTSEKFLVPNSKDQLLKKPVVIPSAVNLNSNKKLSKQKPEEQIEKQQIQSVQNPVRPEPQISQNIVRQQAQTTQNIGRQQAQTTQNIVGQQAQTSQNIIQSEPQIKQNTIGQVETQNTLKSEPQENVENLVVPVKRGRGRPRKNPLPDENAQPIEKKKRGRPRKNPLPEETQEQYILPGMEEETIPTIQDLDDEEETILPGIGETQETSILPGVEETQEDDILLPGLGTTQEDDILPGLGTTQEDNILPGLGTTQEDNILPGLGTTQEDDILPGLGRAQEDDILPGLGGTQEDNILPGLGATQEDDILPGLEQTQEETMLPGIEKNEEYTVLNTNQETKIQEPESTIDINNILSEDQKIVTFVGTSKNGTSFIVNNLAEMISNAGIDVAILDTTQNRNSYYIYTKNEEQLRNIAMNSIAGLANGIAEGVKVHNNLTIYTSLPEEGEMIVNVDKILQTLAQKHKLILIDADFKTPIGYFKQAQQIYLVQTLDILTIQPLTAFLRDLKAKNILDEEKLRIVLNKTVRIRGITDKTIIGGMAYYNDPAMSFMTELFDRNSVKYVNIPFEPETYVRYLEGIIECEISLKGYSKQFMQTLKELAIMVYPKLGENTKNNKGYRPPSISGKKANKNEGENNFTPSMNNALNQMKMKY